MSSISKSWGEIKECARDIYEIADDSSLGKICLIFFGLLFTLIGIGFVILIGLNLGGVHLPRFLYIFVDVSYIGPIGGAILNFIATAGFFVLGIPPLALVAATLCHKCFRFIKLKWEQPKNYINI